MPIGPDTLSRLPGITPIKGVPPLYVPELNLLEYFIQELRRAVEDRVYSTRRSSRILWSRSEADPPTVRLELDAEGPESPVR